MTIILYFLYFGTLRTLFLLLSIGSKCLSGVGVWWVHGVHGAETSLGWIYKRKSEGVGGGWLCVEPKLRVEGLELVGLGIGLSGLIGVCATSTSWRGAESYSRVWCVQTIRIIGVEGWLTKHSC